MITVVAGGDSFVWGSELHDCRSNQCSQHTFPALLAADYNYTCAAWPGNGNDSIARAIVNYCEHNPKDNLVVLVSWTFSSRYEFRFTFDTKQRNSPWYTINSWTVEPDVELIREQFITDNEAIYQHQVNHIKRAQQTGIVAFADLYYKNVGSSEYWEVYTSLKEMVYLQNYLKCNAIPYLFTCADNNVFHNYTVDSADITIVSLLNQLDMKQWFFFEPGIAFNQTQTPRGFYQWALENKYKIGTTHPLEEAHRDAAKLMQEKFNEVVKELNQQNQT